MAKFFGGRTLSTARAGATTSGFGNDFAHVSGQQTAYPVTDKGGYALVNMVINTPPASGTMILKCGSDIIAVISGATTSAREFKYSCYMYDRLLYWCDDAAADVTFIISKNVGP